MCVFVASLVSWEPKLLWNHVALKNVCSLLSLNYSCFGQTHVHSLGENSIGDEGAKELAVALQTNTSLTTLS
jgi:hypothetical protein